MKQVSQQEKERQKDVAAEILKQLGGNKFMAMTGAKEFGFCSRGLGFKIGRNSSKANYVQINYDQGKDLYTVIFTKNTFSNKTFEMTIKELGKFEGVYCDKLQEIFTNFTGMDTHL